MPINDEDIIKFLSDEPLNPFRTFRTGPKRTAKDAVSRSLSTALRKRAFMQPDSGQHF